MSQSLSQVKGSEDLYALLRVAPQASLAEIKESFRQLVKIHHPDKGGDHQMFIKIAEAYNVLKDPDLRAEYDQTGGVDWASMSAEDVFDFLDAQDNKHHSAPPAARLRLFDTVCELEIDAKMIGNTVSKNVSRQVVKPGAGPKHRGCSKCHYTGEVFDVRGSGKDVTRFKVACSCVPRSIDLTMKQQEMIQVTIPPDAKDGTKIRIQQKGDEYPGADPGDLVFIIKLKQQGSALWTSDGTTTVLISLQRLQKNAMLWITMPDGSREKMDLKHFLHQLQQRPQQTVRAHVPSNPRLLVQLQLTPCADQHGYQQSAVATPAAPAAPTTTLLDSRTAQKRVDCAAKNEALRRNGSSVVSPHSCKLRMEAGCRVQVMQPFKIKNSSACLDLKSGDGGTVQEIDSDGFANVKFDCHQHPHWVQQSDLGKLKVVEKRCIAERDATTGLLKTPVTFSFDEL